MKIISKKCLSLFLGGMLFAGMLTQPMQVHAAEREWTLGYTGGQQEFTAPYSGIYRFELAGAQGGNCTFAGGKGGKITVLIKLQRGEQIELFVGGQNGYNGGGCGTISNGGGATDIRRDGERIAIAGGGGGATEHAEGGVGGTQGNNGVSYHGDSAADISGSAGGGGGHQGGTAGYYYTVTTAHSHEDACYKVCEGIVSYEDANGDGFSVGHCNICGRELYDANQQPGCHPEPLPCKNRILLCEKSEEPVTTSFEEFSYGGSNWFEPSCCQREAEEAGVQEGNGACNIKILSLYQLVYKNKECQTVYYAGTKVKQIYFRDSLIYME